MDKKNKLEKTSDQILKILIKEPFIDHTITSLSDSLGITRQGLWKTLNKLADDRLITMKKISDTKTSVILIRLDFENLLTKKTISLLLTKESLDHDRWRNELKELEHYTDFIILFGSILKNPKEANDIDIIIVADKKEFKSIDDIKNKIQKTQIKEIHLIDMTKQEFKTELKNNNKAYIDAIKKGVILYGQEDYIDFVHGLRI